MKILFVIESLGSGGAQRQMVNLARGLNARGHHVQFFTYYEENHYRPLLDEVGMHVHLHLKQSRFSVDPIIALRRLIRQKNYDVVLSFLRTPSFYAEIACIGMGNTKLVVSERFMYLSGTLPRGLRLLQECHRLADAITVNSHHQRVRMIQEFTWMVQKVQTIYNGVDLERFAPLSVRPEQSAEPLLLIAIGTIVAKKNMLNLGKALTICRIRYNLEPIVRWVGKQDFSSDGKKAFAEIAEFLHKNSLNDQWEWLGERSDIPELLRQHDALIHPSFYEGLPNVVCEALASGLPVLASNVCDHPRLVEEGVSGFLFDPHSPDSIAEAVHKFYRSSPDYKCSMGNAARKFAETNLDITLFCDMYEKLFLSLSSGPAQA